MFVKDLNGRVLRIDSSLVGNRIFHLEGDPEDMWFQPDEISRPAKKRIAPRDAH